MAVVQLTKLVTETVPLDIYFYGQGYDAAEAINGARADIASAINTEISSNFSSNESSKIIKEEKKVGFGLLLYNII